MKRIITFLSISAAFGILYAGDGFTTTLQLDGFADSTLIVARIQDGGNDGTDFTFDSLYTSGGRAVVSGVSRADEPATMYVFTPSGTITTFVYNGCSETISGDTADIGRRTLGYSGAPWSADMMDYNTRIQVLWDRSNAEGRKYAGMSDEQRKAFLANMHAVDSLERRYFVEHPNAWYTLRQMQFRMMDMERADVQSVYNSLFPEQRASRYGRLMARYLSVKPIEKGDSLAAYDIVARNQYGDTVRLTQFTEPYLLLDFSQLYCGPCVAAAKEIAAIKNKYAGRVAFINYSCDETEDMWLKAVERDKPAWQSLFNGSGPGGDDCLRYNINSYPTFFVFGPDRTLLDRREGYGPGMLDSYISTFLNDKNK